MDNNDKIKEINKEISHALFFWQKVVNIADADEWAYYINYDDDDLLNALYIFNHVAQNIAIKNGFYKDPDEALDKMQQFVKHIEEVYGFNSIELTNKVLNLKIQKKWKY